jgi:selenide,water dikinase
LLTKPLGTGLITTAGKRGLVEQAHLEAAIQSMLTLNKRAAELAMTVEIHSATDITGFGLLGHAAEIARNSGIGLQIIAAALPLLPGALDYARAGIAPGGLGRNRDFLEQDGYVRIAENVEMAHQLLLYDPQTSGGLLFVLAPAAAEQFQRACVQADQPCWQIGEVVAGSGIAIS